MDRPLDGLGIGWVMQPDADHLERTRPLLDRVDYLELAPETTWTTDRRGHLTPNGFHARFAEERARGLPFVAHSTALSMAADPRGDEARRARWLERVALDHETFRFAWWTDHFGATSLPSREGPRYVALPVPVPANDDTLAHLERTLDAMQAVVPHVGFENTAFHFAWDEAEHEPWLLRRALAAKEGRHLLLDLHNLVLNAEQQGYDARRWLRTIDLSKVIEIHVAGGTTSDPAWLPSGRSLRLDGHDHAVPEGVWSLLVEVLPRCTNLRGVTLERMEGTVESEADVAALARELDRLRTILEGPRPTQETALDRALPFDRPHAPAAALDPDAYLALLRDAELTSDDGRRMTALLVAKLRFERLQRGSDLAMQWFDESPQRFAELFRSYHLATPMEATFPAQEADRFFAFCERRGLVRRVR
ncbi:MAG: DUF692 family protein [Deltaproteobacteria bacterium]|nr:DUF692 family protein [Deltaproteobacteria bacterium]